MFRSDHADVRPVAPPTHEAVPGRAADFGDAPAGAAPHALAETKRPLTAKVLEAFDLDAGEPARLSARLSTSADAHEGMTAFLERRDPAWVL